MMSGDLKERAQPHDEKDMIESAKALFTGTMATRERRTDLDRNVFYAARPRSSRRRCARTSKCGR